MNYENNEKKEAIESETAKSFLKLYNSQFKTSFKVIEISDAPDVICQDTNGNELSLEITLSEDRAGDIEAQLGRSKSRDIDIMMEQNDIVDCLHERPSKIITERINKKIDKFYGRNVALVVRHASGTYWNWGLEVLKIKNSLDLPRFHFDKGIWIITNFKDRIWRVA